MVEYKSTIPEITLKYKSGDVKKVKISSSRDAFSLLKQFYDEDTIELTESSVVVFFNRANNSLGWIKVSNGGLASCIIDTRLILATALKCAASGIIISHNHPSGNVKPSEQDDRITKKLNDGCKILDIVFMDHIIVGDDRYYSYKDEGNI